MAGGTPATALAELARTLREEGSVISPHVRDSDAPPALGLLAAAGPATRRDPMAYALIVESVREGYLLHYGSPRVVAPPDEDLALLAGDYLYALGLERLAALGDLASVRELSDLIGLSAQLHAHRPTGEDDEGAALWLASAAAIATGPSDSHERAKAELRAGGGPRALLRSALEAASDAGLDEQLASAAETVGFAPFHRG